MTNDLFLSIWLWGAAILVPLALIWVPFSRGYSGPPHQLGPIGECFMCAMIAALWPFVVAIGAPMVAWGLLEHLGSRAKDKHLGSKAKEKVLRK